METKESYKTNAIPQILGVDIGGTFTDLFEYNPAENKFRIAKVPTTPMNQGIGFLNGISKIGLKIYNLSSIIHATTIATNTILERKGGKCVLITTKGFRDILELGRRTRPHVYGLHGSYEPIIPRNFRLEITERIDGKGNIYLPLVKKEIPSLLLHIKKLNVESIVINFLHSYANPIHEQLCASLIREHLPNIPITLASDIMPEIREFERCNTAALNGYVQTRIMNYLKFLERELKKRKFSQKLLIMQGNGGMMDASHAVSNSVNTVMSGPAAGAIAAGYIGIKSGYHNLVACDMGGTSFDVSLVINGEPAITREKEIDYSLPIHVPMIDIHTIGAGGGSIARLNDGGILQVGPESAGAIPGPMAYGNGGIEPTVTDANLILGRINHLNLTAVDIEPDLENIEKSLLNKIGKFLGLNVVETASAILAIANNAMAGAIRFVLIEKGYDPRDFILFAFGGAGPLHASSLARELGIPKILIPLFPGINSALGCVVADIRYDFGQSVGRLLQDVSQTDGENILLDQTMRGKEIITRQKVLIENITVRHEADLMFAGQSHVIRIPIEGHHFNPKVVLQNFLESYKKRFETELPGMRPVLMALRTTLLGNRPGLNFEQMLTSGSNKLEDVQIGFRQVFFDGKWHNTPIYDRNNLAVDTQFVGPAIFEQIDTTIIVEPDDKGFIDRFGNLCISVENNYLN